MHILKHASRKTLFSERTSEAHAQKPAVTQHVSTKLSPLSCLIAIKRSNTHKLMLKTQMSYKTDGYVSEGKQLGKKLDVSIRSVWQQCNIQ